MYNTEEPVRVVPIHSPLRRPGFDNGPLETQVPWHQELLIVAGLLDRLLHEDDFLVWTFD